MNEKEQLIQLSVICSETKFIIAHTGDDDFYKSGG